MGNLKKYIILSFLMVNTVVFSQFEETNTINESQFNTEKKADSLNFIKQINYKYQNAWAYIDYHTGDDRNCINKKGIHIKENNNSFSVTNQDKTKTDIWVTFLKITGPKSFELQRQCFVKHNDSFSVKELQAGDYKLMIEHGNKWKQPLNDYNGQGRFVENNNMETSYACSKIYTVSKNSTTKFTSYNEIVECNDKNNYQTSTR